MYRVASPDHRESIQREGFVPSGLPDRQGVYVTETLEAARQYAGATKLDIYEIDRADYELRPDPHSPSPEWGWRYIPGPVSPEHIKLLSVVQKHGDHDQADHGNWAHGPTAGQQGAAQEAAESEVEDYLDRLERHLVDYKTDRPLEGGVSITEVTPMKETVHYLDVPGIDTMHARMGIQPTLETNLDDYMEARNELFGYQPIQEVPLDHLHATQDVVNPDRVAALSQLPEQLEKPVFVLQNGEDYYLMNGHHRVAASGYAGFPTVTARVLDTTDVGDPGDMVEFIVDRIGDVRTVTVTKATFWREWSKVHLLKHGGDSHDQEDHGNWARGGAAPESESDAPAEGSSLVWPDGQPFPEDGEGPFGGLTLAQAQATVLDRIMTVAEEKGLDGEDLVERYEEWKEAIEENKDLATDKQFATEVVTEDGETELDWDDDREALQWRVVQDFYDQAGASVANDADALLMGGLPGSGKGFALSDDSGLELPYDAVEAPGETGTHLVINPDIFKALLVENGMAPAVEGLTGGELAPLIHEESSEMAMKLYSLAAADGKNIIWDWTMPKPSSIQERIDPLLTVRGTPDQATSYYITMGYIDTPPHVALEQAISRWAVPGNEGRIVNFDLLAMTPNTPRNLESFQATRGEADESFLIHRNEDGELEVQPGLEPA